MSLSLSLGLAVGLGLGCGRGPEPSPGTGTPLVTAQPGDVAAKPSPNPGPTPNDGLDEPDPVAPVTDGSPCEQICATVYTCVLHESGSNADGTLADPSAAAAIELGCLDGCVRSPETFAACEPPIDHACGPYLSCVRAAWPMDERPDTVVESIGNGCELACGAFARCRGEPEEAAAHCARLCVDTLDRDQQRLAAGCAKLESCGEIEKCILSFPGA